MASVEHETLRCRRRRAEIQPSRTSPQVAALGAAMAPAAASWCRVCLRPTAAEEGYGNVLFLARGLPQIELLTSDVITNSIKHHAENHTEPRCVCPTGGEAPG